MTYQLLCEKYLDYKIQITDIIVLRYQSALLPLRQIHENSGREILKHLNTTIRQVHRNLNELDNITASSLTIPRNSDTTIRQVHENSNELDNISFGRAVSRNSNTTIRQVRENSIDLYNIT